jgi:hypothetical protein
MLPQDVLSGRPELSPDSTFAELWGDAGASLEWRSRVARGVDRPTGRGIAHRPSKEALKQFQKRSMRCQQRRDTQSGLRGIRVL